MLALGKTSHRVSAWRFAAPALMIAAVPACGNAFQASPAGNGGTTAKGGGTSSGGATTFTGGGPSSGGKPGTAGSIGIGGVTGIAGGPETGGTVGTGGTSGCATGATCGPLMISDLTGIDTSSLSGFNVGFRCKALTVCSPEESCLYYAADLGSIQSSEATDTYTDGAELSPAVAAKIGIDVGAASQCGNPPLQIADGESVVLSFDGTSVRVYFPKVVDTAVTLYVRSDGATFYDAALTQLAHAPLPTP